MNEYAGSSTLVCKQEIGAPSYICPNGHLSHEAVRIELSDNWKQVAVIPVCVYCLRDILIKLPQVRRVSE